MPAGSSAAGYRSPGEWCNLKNLWVTRAGKAASVEVNMDQKARRRLVTLLRALAEKKKRRLDCL
jgi:hypothetical protein